MYKSKIFGDLNIPSMFRKKAKPFKYVPAGMNSSTKVGTTFQFNASCSAVAMSSVTTPPTQKMKRKIIEDPSEGSPDGIWVEKPDLDLVGDLMQENEYLKQRLSELGEDEI